MFRVYDASNHPLSSADIGSFVLAIVELRCLEVGQSSTAFSRVGALMHALLYCVTNENDRRRTGLRPSRSGVCRLVITLMTKM